PGSRRKDPPCGPANGRLIDPSTGIQLAGRRTFGRCVLPGYVPRSSRPPLPATRAPRTMAGSARYEEDGGPVLAVRTFTLMEAQSHLRILTILDDGAMPGARDPIGDDLTRGILSRR